MITFIKKTFRLLGMDLHRYTPELSAMARLEKLLLHHNISLVLDVGANAGQYASSLRDIGYRGRIVSFEPLSSAHERLTARSKNDPAWEIAPRMAIGNIDGETTINVSKNSLSSSVLDILDAHVRAAPDSAYVASEIVKMSRLDSIAPAYIGVEDSVYLKMDVQGFEMRVLEGAAGILQRIKGIQMELSLTPLYRGETLFDDMLHHMEHLGYDIFSLAPGFTDAKTGRLLQIDGIFFRK